MRMAGLTVSLWSLTFFCSIIFNRVLSSPINIPLQNVSDLLIQSALNSLNEDSPTRHTYKSGSLISAQKLEISPYIVYKLTLNLDPVCDEDSTSCPREACAIDLKKHELGVIEIERNSIQCMYLYPQSRPDDVQQLQENGQETNNQDQSIIESLDKQIINQSIELTHEVQTAADQNDKPFIAVRASNPNYCAGCPYELNPTLPGISAFGEQIVQTMDESTQSDFKHKVISIVRIIRAVPPGSNVVQYQLLLEIGESECLKTALIERSECLLQSNVPIKLCLVTFEERPWQQNSRLITNNNCTEFQTPDNEVNVSVSPNLASESLTTLKREQPIQESVVKTEHYNQVDEERKVATFKSLIDELFDDPVTSSTVQIENEQPKFSITEKPFIKIELNRDDQKHESEGFTNKIKEFDAFLENFDVPVKTEDTDPTNIGIPVTEEIINPMKVNRENSEIVSNFQDGTQMHEQDEINDELQYAESKWNMERQISEAHVDSSKESNESINNKDSGIELDRKRRSLVNTPTSESILVKKIAQKAVNILDDIDLDNKKRVILDVLDFKKHKTNGIIYHVTVKVAPTHCGEKYKNHEACLDEIDGPTKICKIQVHTNEKMPLHSAKVMQSECYNEREKINARVRRTRQLVGAPTTISIDDPDVKRYSNLGLRKFSENSEGTNEPILVEIVEATRQIVAGTLDKIKVKLGTSNCPKGVTENCQLKADSEIKECSINVWSRPWLDNGSPDIQIKCDIKERKKRSLRGVHYSQKMLEQSKSIQHEWLFNNFINEFNKTYSSTEETKNRFTIFKNNLKMIEELQVNERGTGQYGITIFSDLTAVEFRTKYLGFRPELRLENQIPIPMAEIPNISLPSEYDWRHYNVVTPVKNQGQCGSCWAFSVTGNVEAQYAIKHEKLLSLSEQELIDCDTLDQGCNGGLPDNAYRSIEKLGGLETETDYSYDAKNEKCQFDKTKVKVSITSAVNITSNETQMAQWLVKNGPISIGINANAMQFYMGGVSHPLKFLCNPEDLDHGVLIVGFGIHTYPLFNRKLPYWTIKNSWGPRWGERGYYRVYRGDGTCGVNQMASSAIVA